MSHQKLLQSLLNKAKETETQNNKQSNNKSNNQPPKPQLPKPPSLKEMMNLLKMIDPDAPDNIEELIDSAQPEEKKVKLDKMYVKQITDSNNINQYLFCKQSGMYLPVGYRYAGYHTSKSNNNKTVLYTRQNEEGYYVVHCLGQKVDKHNNYDVYVPIDITSQLNTRLMQMVKDGIEIQI